ncbi:MAG TPA: HAMP domain-containing sensor histidine kinase [Bacillota bacterium]|nr:HAMP domain-containing sensor histidine kinase [Bacillota bacterium]
MKMRFWQKTYILTLTLFLACLYTGLFVLAYYTYERSSENTKNACVAEQSYIVMSFERDYEDITDSYSPSILMQSYVAHYGARGILLAFFEDGSAVCSGFKNTIVQENSGIVKTLRIDGEKYVVIHGTAADKYGFVYARYAGDLDDEFRSLIITYALVAAGVSVLLAVILLFILKKLSLPLEKLKSTTETIAGGDMTVAADETGNDEFSALAKSFNKMVGKVRCQMNELADDAHLKQRLVDNMAHEMRTPLTSIRGYAEYIEKAAVPDEEKNDAAGRIVTETDRLRKISEKILDTAFLRETAIERKKVDLCEVLQDTSEKLSQKAKARGITITVNAADSVVEGDVTLLSMLFCNLVENAIKACADGGNITLSYSGQTACVADDGKGMTPEQLTHITEPFYRTDKSRSRVEGGAGLGLALCSQIADSHSAKLRFESEVGKGTKVFIDFTTSQQL